MMADRYGARGSGMMGRIGGWRNGKLGRGEQEDGVGRAVGRSRIME